MAVGRARWCCRRRVPVDIDQRPWSGPLVSVIVTCYNYGVYLDRVLDSLAAQSWRNFEIILIDDGSTDPVTCARIAALKKLQHPDFTVIQQPNQGVIAARNHAIGRARGRYIFPLDADDTIAATFLEKCLLFLENAPENFFVYTWTNSVAIDEFIWKTRDSHPELALKENRMGYALFRKAAFVEVGGYNPVMSEGYEDWELSVNLVANGYVGRVIREPLYNYYVKPGARNDHARKKDQILRAKIEALHGETIRTRKKCLWQVACCSGRVHHSLVNLGIQDWVGKEPILFDLYHAPRVSPVVLKDLMLWVENSSEPVLLTLARRWQKFFLQHNLDNLWVYYPEEYHPVGETRPFYDYLQLRYKPRRITLGDIW